MADKTIGELPQVGTVTAGSMIPIEQSNTAYHMTGAQFQAWAVAGASPYATAAQNSANAANASAGVANTKANEAASSASAAAGSAGDAVAAKNAILDMGVAANALPPGSTPTVTKSSSAGVVTLTYGIPAGEVGPAGQTGPQGPQGVQGPKGDTGTAAVVAADGLYGFHVVNDSSSPQYGHLILTYTGESAPDFAIDTDVESETYGHLILTFEEEE